MPIDEYRCRACDKAFEKSVPGAATKVACPACASADITRKLSVFGLKSDGGFVASSMPSGGGCCGGGGRGGPLSFRVGPSPPPNFLHVAAPGSVFPPAGAPLPPPPPPSPHPRAPPARSGGR